MVTGVEDFAGSRAVVMGFGRFGGGRSAAEFLLDQGAHVLVTDLSEAHTLDDSIACLSSKHREAIEWKLGCHDLKDFTSADIVIANPAVSTSNKYLQAARDAGAWVTTDIELFLRLTDMRLVLITGTQGKSSSAQMTAGLLQSAGFCVHLGGNIGNSLLPTLTEKSSSNSIAVIELSSYQLEALPQDSVLARAEVVAITNLLEDHISRHGTIACYHQAKARILDLLTHGGVAIASFKDLQLSPLREEHARRMASAEWLPFQAHTCDAGLGLQGGDFTIHGKVIAPVTSLPLPGDFQQLNALVAIGAALSIGVSIDAIASALPKLEGLPHRAQDLGTFTPGDFPIRIIDNAVSTTPDSTQSVLESLEGPVTLLVGGRSKGQDLSRLAAACTGRVAHVLCFGEAAPELHAAFSKAGANCHAFATMDEAVAQGLCELASPTLLFSPACSSFDQFSNFKQRALAFHRALPS